MYIIYVPITIIMKLSLFHALIEFKSQISKEEQIYISNEVLSLGNINFSFSWVIYSNNSLN
jgi:hypothetical protein